MSHSAPPHWHMPILLKGEDHMKVKDLIEQDIDVDVYDNVCEELCIAFCGPIRLTEQGKEKFSDVLEYGVEYERDVAIINCDAAGDRGYMKRVRKAQAFFEAAAGYCAADDWDKWFTNEEV